MNCMRRTVLQAACDKITEMRELLEGVRDEEEEYKGNIPENLQNTKQYTKAEAAIDALESAISSIEEAADYIKQAQE